ncbi:MAG: hypothetical protein Q9224_000722 [Gallowayella concinna]
MAPSTSQRVPKKNKKKNAPDRAQPEWMFPPDEANPVLNPKPKSEKEIQRNKQEWEAAIKFLQHRIHSAPVRPAPPKRLLTLVGAFLTQYGFNNTCRIYQLQCNARSKLDAWDSVLGEKLPEDFPDLVQLYKYGLQTYEEKQRLEETSSSDGENAAATGKNRKKRRKLEDIKAKEEREATMTKAEQTSSSGSSDDGDAASKSDFNMKDASPAPKPSKSHANTKGLISPSSSTSSSDSDADDENETAGLGAPLRKSTVIELTNKLKRKTPPSASSSSSSSSASSSSEEEPASKKAKKQGTKDKSIANAVEPAFKKTTEKPQSAANSPVESSSSSSISSGSDSEERVKPVASESKDDHLPGELHNTKTIQSSDSDSSSTSSDSGDDEFTVPKIKRSTDEPKISSDSSVTLVATPTITTSESPEKRTATSTSSSSSSSSSDSDSDASSIPAKNGLTDIATKNTKQELSASPKPAVEATTTVKTEQTPTETTTTTTITTKKEQKPKATPFSRIPANTHVPAALSSNAYKSYDYAERAHQDLSVTKGKNFTKEKNKKKRGSYRGGAIDTGPGRAIKFED